MWFDFVGGSFLFIKILLFVILLHKNLNLSFLFVMSFITDRPSRFNRTRTRDNLRRRGKQWWDTCPSWSSCSSTISSSRLMSGEQVKKPAASPQRLSEFQPLLCSHLIDDESPLSLPNNKSSSSLPIVIPATTGKQNGVDDNVVVNTPPPHPSSFSKNSTNRSLSSIPIVIPDTTIDKTGINDNTVVNTPSLPFYLQIYKPGTLKFKIN